MNKENLAPALSGTITYGSSKWTVSNLTPASAPNDWTADAQSTSDYNALCGAASGTGTLDFKDENGNKASWKISMPTNALGTDSNPLLIGIEKASK